jgi:hypothetical protein
MENNYSFIIMLFQMFVKGIRTKTIENTGFVPVSSQIRHESGSFPQIPPFFHRSRPKTRPPMRKSGGTADPRLHFRAFSDIMTVQRGERPAGLLPRIPRFCGAEITGYEADRIRTRK